MGQPCSLTVTHFMAVRRMVYQPFSSPQNCQIKYHISIIDFFNHDKLDHEQNRITFSRTKDKIKIMLDGKFECRQQRFRFRC